MVKIKNKHAVLLGKMGGKKGGKARMKQLRESGELKKFQSMAGQKKGKNRER